MYTTAIYILFVGSEEYNFPALGREGSLFLLVQFPAYNFGAELALHSYPTFVAAHCAKEEPTVWWSRASK